MARIFISHSSLDREQAAQLLKWLRDQGFASTFLDFDKHAGLAPGADWEHTLYRELAGSDAVILILTKNWFDSKWCFAEFTQARALGKAIFPLVEAPTGETFVSSDIQHLDLVKDREGGMERLRAELTRIALNTRSGFPWDSSRPPYPGLLAFDESDAAIYFGRDDDIRRLIERLNARRAQGGEKLIAVLGASGSGKSSLLRAGVVPRLKRDAHNWIVLPAFRPQMHPLDELAQAVAAGLGTGANWREWRTAFDGENPSEALAGLGRDLRGAHGANEAQILIVIDQGEELFGGGDAKETEKFFTVLSALLEERLPFLAVIALRSDYLDRLQQAPGLTAAFEDFPLKPMPIERVRDIIEGPARVAGIAVDDALVAAAMKDAATDDALPLLAFALRELYDRSAKSGRLTEDAYRALGDSQAQLSPLENSVRRKADEVLAATKPSPEDLQALKEAFIPAMVRVNAEGEYVRRSAALDGVSSRARPLIERLAKARLLIIRRERDAALVEVAHEALLRKWPLLRGWLDEEREFLVGKDQIEQDLLDWERAAPEQKTEALLTGLKLTRARTWLTAKPLQLSKPEHKFIQASIEHYEEEAARKERARRRILQASVFAALALAIVAGAAVWEWWQANQQRIQAESRQLASQSEQHLNNDDGLALREAVEAGERSQTDEAQSALSAVLSSPQERYIFHHKGFVETAVFSSDGKRVVTACNDNTSRVWDATNGQLLETLSGHSGPVNSAAFSLDGERIVTASDDHTAREWDAQNGQLLATLSGHMGDINTAFFSPDGTRIVTASDDNTAKLWDARTGHAVATLSGHSANVHDAVFSPDGKHVVTSSEDHTARIWDAESGHLVATLSGHTGEVFEATFSSDGKRIITASADATARIWDAEDGHLLFTLAGHMNEVDSAAFSPDGKLAVTSSIDHTARVWDAGSGKMLATLVGHSDFVNDAEFSPDGNFIVTASSDDTARIWDAGKGRLLAILSGNTGAVVHAAFSSDGARVITAGNDDTARVWDLGDGQLVAALYGHSGNVFRASFSPDGSRVVTASYDHTARVWDTGNGNLLATLSGHTKEVNDARFSPDGERIVTASFDKTARIWDAANGNLLLTLTGHQDMVLTAEFSPDGTRIVTASDDGTARIWDADSGRSLATLTGHTSYVYSAEFSSDGTHIVTASNDNTARVWDARDGRLIAILTGHTGSVISAEFSPDGKRIVTNSADDTARVWDATDWHLLVTLSGHTQGVGDAEFSPDGKQVVTAGFDGTARIWDAESGRLLSTLSGHTDAVRGAQYSRDGKRIVTASFDRTARVWDGENGHLLATLTGHTYPVNDAAFSPDGKRVVTASADWTSRIYVVDFDELLSLAKQRLPVDSGQ